MITYNELVKLKPKQIKHNNVYYYVVFYHNKKNDLYVIQLYKKIEDPTNPLFHTIIIYDSKQTIEEANISQNYGLVFTSTIDSVVKKLEQVDSVAIHSPTYIQDIIEKFFEMYLEGDLKTTKLKKEKTLQLENYKNWDGVIKL